MTGVQTCALPICGVHPEGLVWIPSHMAKPRGWRSQVGWIATVVTLLAVVVLLQRFPHIGRGLTIPPRDNSIAMDTEQDTQPTAISESNSTGSSIGGSRGEATNSGTAKPTEAEPIKTAAARETGTPLENFPPMLKSGKYVVETIVPLMPIILPVGGAVLIFMLAFIAVFMA